MCDYMIVLKLASKSSDFQVAVLARDWRSDGFSRTSRVRRFVLILIHGESPSYLSSCTNRGSMQVRLN